jgi:hypothetical protein
MEMEMIIKMRKIGSILDSRPAGREALLAVNPDLPKEKSGEVALDFEGVEVLTPSFADEFITPLLNRYPDHVIIQHAKQNAEIMEVLSFLAEAWSTPPTVT